MRLHGTKGDLARMWRDQAKRLHEFAGHATVKASALEHKTRAHALEDCATALEMLQDTDLPRTDAPTRVTHEKIRRGGKPISDFSPEAVKRREYQRKHRAKKRAAAE